MESTELETILSKLTWACRYSLSVKRFGHVKRVIDHGRALSDYYGIDSLRIAVAAAGHDMARELPPSRMHQLADEYGVPDDDPLREHPVMLHGPVASGMMAERYDVTDDELLNAVYHHTLGSPKLGRLGKLLYVADYTEPGRPYLDASLRAELLRDELNETVAAVIRHAGERFGPIHRRTKEFLTAVTTGAAK